MKAGVLTSLFCFYLQKISGLNALPSGIEDTGTGAKVFSDLSE